MCSYLHRHPNGRYYFRMGIPAELRSYFGKREFKKALHTSDRAEAKGMIPAMTGKAHGLLNEARIKLGVPAPASPPPPVFTGPVRDQDDYDRWLADNPHYEYYPDDDEREDFQAFLADIGRAETEVPKAHSIKALFERYAESGTANPKTVSRWRCRVADLVAFLGHDDVTRVTRADLNRWIAALVAKPVAGKTIRDGYLPAIRAALNLAHDDEIIPSNPASGLTVRAPKPVQLRERGLTDDEAATILAATTLPQPPKLGAEHKLARRWAPWLCAYTGARIGEITQLRPCDILQIEGTWCIHITPEAGSVKTNKARKVPLHPHLIEQGFTKFAKAGDKTPLFYRDGAGNAENPGSKLRASDIAKWVRSLGVDDPNVPPNHGWRHRFKTQARMLGIPEEVHDAITGHAPPNEGRKYGSVPLPVLVEAIGRLPRYEV